MPTFASDFRHALRTLLRARAFTAVCVVSLGLGMGVTSIGLSLYYRTPVVTAWSTPGAALLVTSLPGTSINEAIGVFVFATGLILLCGVTGLFAKMMHYIPQALSDWINKR